METSINPAQIAQIVTAIELAANAVVIAVACLCFFVGLNSWESSAK
jgi:hypothetical protein